jgi:iron complex outermembrane receptor protein
MKLPKIITVLSLPLILVQTALAETNTKADQLLEEELAYLHAENYVYSAGKKMEKIHDVASAVFVISHDDIRRSGASNIPDVLRMVPGLQVAEIDANKWAISARGLNARFSTNLLVLIDGRTVYTPVFSGVNWHREDTPLEDVERIEVIRGAGAAMWGSNAVNGVINVITKSAKDTQGALINAGAGNQERGFAHLRYGGKIGEDFNYRVYGKGFERNHNLYDGNKNARDGMENYQAGFKSEWQLGKDDTLTTQGDIYHSHTSDIEEFASFSPPYKVSNQLASSNSEGGNLQTRWKHKISDTAETALQIYYKQDDSRRVYMTPQSMREKTLDVEFQHRFHWSDNDIIWGLGYRDFDLYYQQGNIKTSMARPHINRQLFSVFFQDDITLLKNELKLTLGTRLEHNDYTGLEIQPNIRLLWTPNNKQSVWGSIARAVRTPTIGNREGRGFTNPLPPISGLAAISSVDGSARFKSENVLDFEVGYRLQATQTLSFDLATFYNKYNRIQSIDVLPAQVVKNAAGAYILVPIQMVNKLKGETLGFELTSQWQPLDWLKLQGYYSLLKDNIYEKSTRQQGYVRASLNLPFEITLDPTVRYVDTVSTYPTPHYVAFDLRAAWKPLKNLELSVTGQNLLDKQHPEFRDNAFKIPQTEIQRSVFGKVSFSF